MEISQHIKNLLKSNERVILGGFGAFNTKQISAKYDEATKTMKPPVKIVTFDPNIKEDAGLLAKFMAEQEGISLENAGEQIREYIKTIKTKLDSGKTVDFKDLGIFNNNPDGTPNFAYLSEDNLLLDSFGLPTVSLDTSKQNIETNIPKKKDTLRKQPIKKKATPIEKPKKDVVKDKPIKKEAVKKKPVKKTPKQKVVKDKTTKPKKKRKGLIIFAIFIGAIGIMLTAVYFFKPDLWKKGYKFSSAKITIVKQKVTKLFKGDNAGEYDIIEPDINETDNETIDSTDVNEENIADENNEEIIDDNSNEVLEENVNTEEDVVEEIEENEVVEEGNVNTNVSPAKKGKYYIIVSSVVSESSAKKEQKRFSKKGINTSIIHVPSQGRYRISAGEYNSVKSAQDAYSEIQSKQGNIEAWVWEKR